MEPRPDGEGGVLTTELVPIETVRAGDDIYFLDRGPFVVSGVNAYDDGTFVLVYFANERESFERRARAKHEALLESMICERSLAPKRTGEYVEIGRGAPLLAEQWRERMRRQEEVRFKKRWSS